MKNKKRNYLVIALIVLLLAVSIGYAALSQIQLTVTGTATGSYSWDIEFTEASLGGTALASSAITNNGHTLTVGDIALGYPGDGKTLVVKVQNKGTLDATLSSFNVTIGGQASDSDIEVSAPSIANETLAAGETCEVTFFIKWKTSSTATTLSGKTISITYAYDQTATEQNGVASHSTHTSAK